MITYLYPEWPAPSHIKACCTLRSGGVSRAPYSSFNLAQHVGDDPALVARNRAQLLADCPGLSAIQWLQQVHGNTVVRLATVSEQTPAADAAITDQRGFGCAVMTADCLPLLLCDAEGNEVAAVHAGWRGLLAGVIEQTVACFHAPAEQLLVWLGPAISQPCFEVGVEVRSAFVAAARQAVAKGSAPSVYLAETEAAFAAGTRANHYLADIYHLARCRLRQVGVNAIFGEPRCTVSETDHFYSYRRDSVTGRMASLIYKC